MWKKRRRRRRGRTERERAGSSSDTIPGSTRAGTLVYRARTTSEPPTSDQSARFRTLQCRHKVVLLLRRACIAFIGSLRGHRSVTSSQLDLPQYPLNYRTKFASNIFRIKFSDNVHTSSRKRFLRHFLLLLVGWEKFDPPVPRFLPVVQVAKEIKKKKIQNKRLSFDSVPDTSLA